MARESQQQAQRNDSHAVCGGRTLTFTSRIATRTCENPSTLTRSITPAVALPSTSADYIVAQQSLGHNRRSGRLTRRALRGCTIPHEPTRRHTELTRAPRAPSRHRTMHVARAIGRAARCVRLRSAGCGRASTGFATAAATARPVVEVAVPSISVEDGGTSSTFPVRRVYCVGKNYAKHTIEMGGDPKKDPPCFFSKPSDAVNQLQFVQYPPMSADVQYEVRHAMRRCAGNRAQV